MGKGQFNIEYLVALGVFISVMIFLTLQTAQAVPQFHSKSVSDRLGAQAYAITNVWIKTPGDPLRWETNVSGARTYGFAEASHKLNVSKISAFNSTCIASYESVKTTIGLERTGDFNIRIFLGNNFIADCGQKRIPAGAVVTSVSRYAAALNGSSIRIDFTMW